MRTPSRFFESSPSASVVGDGSLNGKVVVEKAMRWWFDWVCEPAARTSGDMSSFKLDMAGAGVFLVFMYFWSGSEERILEARNRRRLWSLRTVFRVLAVLRFWWEG